MLTKQKCYRCCNKAVWWYMPSDRAGETNYPANNYYCEDHVSRGCSCNMEEDGTQPLDDKGREYPCCEYDYNQDGYEAEDDDGN